MDHDVDLIRRQILPQHIINRQRILIITGFGKVLHIIFIWLPGEHDHRDIVGILIQMLVGKLAENSHAGL